MPTSPQYREIYNNIVSTDQRYNLPGNSPGLRVVMESGHKISMISGRSLDIGCGVGFAIEYLLGPSFDLLPFGVDISDIAIERALHRLEAIPGMPQRLSVIQDTSLPFDDEFFSLVTCLDVLEHLDESDIDAMFAEMHRVARKGAVLLVSVSTRKSGVLDQFGDNLHRTVQGIDWWVERFVPDHAEFDGHRKQLTMWKHIPLVSDAAQPVVAKQQPAGSSNNGADEVDGHPRESAALYQKIYDENPWYGNAEEDRCPGVRLLPEYGEWLKGPVIDLGCGRGQTVAKLREMGLVAEGIDQISLNPDMRVGDITKPIEGIDRFRSAVCIDCIEHLYDDQVLGLFENMKRVTRQAFSIHNGESTGTGQELHVNRKDFVDWTKLVREHFEIASAIQLHENQILYLTQSKSS